MQTLHHLRWQVKARKLYEVTVQHQRAIEQRDAAATAAQMDMENFRPELRASEEPVCCMRVKIER